MNSLIPTYRDRGALFRPRYDIFDRVFGGFRLTDSFKETNEWLPKIDVHENGDAFVITAEVPGINTDDINITVTDGLLTLSGEKKHDREDTIDGHHVRERRFGCFKRSFRLPVDVDAEKIDAAYKDGVLTVSVPKPEEAPPKKIAVKH